ncbi:MAG TPA: porin [Rhodopila sp.]|nr:porin [Rhodopila sp.]
MRRLLLTTAAMIGAASQLAHGQPAPANPSQGQLAAPYGAGPAPNNNNNAWGVANTPSGSKAAGPISTIYAPNTDAVPAPGTVVIRLNGRVEADLEATFTSVDKGRTATGAPNGYKLNPLGIGTSMRLFPAFDGLAANGLRYGASVEIRENFTSGTYPGQLNGSSPTTTTLTTSPTAAATSPSSNTSGQTLFVRRAFTYIASDQAGILRLGQGDGVLGLFDNCVFTSQCWDAGENILNTSGLTAFAPSAAIVPFAWLDQTGAEYGNNKIVYLSPQFFGFDFGVQYAPSQGNALQASGVGVGCTQAGPTCINVTSGSDPTRWYNQVGVGLRWQQTFGPADVKAYGFYETAGKENLTTAAFTPPSPGANPATLRYDNLSFYKAGLAVTAYNVTAAVDYIGGAINGALQMRPTGGVPMNAWLAGLTYANGPITLGADFGVIDSQGDARLTGFSQRHEYEVAFGGNYKLAPGIQLVAAYTYAHRYQGGFDFSQNAPGAVVDGVRRTVPVQAQELILGTVLTW